MKVIVRRYVVEEIDIPDEDIKSEVEEIIYLDLNEELFDLEKYVKEKYGDYKEYCNSCIEDVCSDIMWNYYDRQTVLYSAIDASDISEDMKDKAEFIDTMIDMIEGAKE